MIPKSLPNPQVTLLLLRTFEASWARVLPFGRLFVCSRTWTVQWCRTARAGGREVRGGTQERARARPRARGVYRRRARAADNRLCRWRKALHAACRAHVLPHAKRGSHAFKAPSSPSSKRARPSSNGDVPPPLRHPCLLAGRRRPQPPSTPSLGTLRRRGWQNSCCLNRICLI